MRPTKLMNHLSQDEVKQRMKASRDRDQFRRWQSIFLTGKGLQADMVAEYVGTTKGTIHQWIYLYNHDGPEGLTLRGRGGRRSGFLSLDEERALLAQVLPLTGKGRIASALAIKTQIEEKIGRRVSKDYLYDILHRHGWQKVMPYPQHSKTDTEELEEFKKNLRSWWQAPRKGSAKKMQGR
ncbi:helix-turn-helix domain-containing protein [Syntrophorhabdus aromaticivorans]|uniref:Winged helix-turn-helix domain-containing protein n=1 Tax=Syntrophorhabdus aromaticivorans TaxID=328301 RepID=A0A971M6E1_9BACT|nr:winged helix-turn-helix domain-containing protein [Syntrophorhabdus aromaticivorans]NLW36777.1 winged helix-turn-helix domain-containing protein [Syntrophorhabdus aromaticivorans]